jgi:hypothetical protein
MAPSRTPRPAVPSDRPNPIQNFQFTEEDFKNPARLNTLFQQLIPHVNALIGAAGPSVLPAGIDVRGSTISGLGPPQSETDAISSGHANRQFSPEAIAPSLDIGGKIALKGLTGLQITSTTLQSSIAALNAVLATGVSGTVVLAKITGGGAKLHGEKETDPMRKVWWGDMVDGAFRLSYGKSRHRLLRNGDTGR